MGKKKLKTEPGNENLRFPAEEEKAAVFPENQIVSEVKHYIKEHLSEETTRTDIADHVKMNESYLSRLFRQETGMALKNYLQAERIGRAKQLLATTNESITTVGEQAGYNTTAYFIKVFREETGQTPGEYRKTMRKRVKSPNTVPVKQQKNMNRENLIQDSRHVGILLKSLSKAIRKGSDQEMAKIGLTASQSFILYFLRDRQGKDICQADIQKQFDLTNPAVTKMVQRMEQKGLVRTTASMEDQRRRNVEITETGLKLLRDADLLREPLEIRTLEGFSMREIKQLEGFMQRMMNNLEASE